MAQHHHIIRRTVMAGVTLGVVALASFVPRGAQQPSDRAPDLVRGNKPG